MPPPFLRDTIKMKFMKHYHMKNYSKPFYYSDRMCDRIVIVFLHKNNYYFNEETFIIFGTLKYVLMAKQ